VTVTLSVLVVDDDVGFRRLAVRTLSSWGHIVVAEVGTCADALVRSAELRPQAVLVDIGLPDGDGFTLARRLAALPWQPRVVVISSDGDAANAPIALQMGAVGFIPKDEIPGSALRCLITGK
jgi:CheY-like chemotaxis protein